MKSTAHILPVVILFICLYFISISHTLAQTVHNTEYDSSNNKEVGQSIEFMFNLSGLFYHVGDVNINRFLSKYKYTRPGSTPVGLRFELSGVPAGKRMIYGISAGTVVSRQDMATADIAISVYYRLLTKRRFWILSGFSVGEHFDRIVLAGLKPAALDSVAKQYKTTLSLQRNGLVLEPAAKAFWFPIKNGKSQLGLFASIYYDLDFNSRWKVGYYPHNGRSFKNLKKSSTVGTSKEFGWVCSTGVSFCF